VVIHRFAEAAAVLIASVTCLGCIDPDISGTRDAVLIAANVGSDDYELQTHPVTADDFTDLEGETVRLIRRPKLIFEQSGSSVSVSVDGDDPMQVSYADDDGALLATDYAGLVAITTFHHMNEAHAYFRGIGLGTTTDDMPQQRVRFLPTFSFPGLPIPLSLNDNMAFVYQIDAYLVLGESVLDEIPLAANQGVVAHEYSHGVLHFLTKDEVGESVDIRYNWDGTSANFWRSLHEGLADVHGVAITNNSNFIAASGRDLLVGRDVSDDHQLQEFHLGNAGAPLESYDPYSLGSVIAATFWTFSEELRGRGITGEEARQQMGRLAFDAVANLDLSSSGFHISDYLRAVTETTTDAAWCDAVRQHFAILQAEAGCP
jgi:hypothetical protein